MSRLGIRLYKRDFTSALVSSDVRLEPVSYSWNALGGPEVAEIRAVGNEWAIWQMCDWLRVPVEIVDEHARAVWWGYIAEVTIGTGAVELGLTLETMANRVAVQYQDLASGSGATDITGWLEDADSVDEYGRFELISSVDSGSPEAAAGLRMRMLDELRYPVPIIRHIGRGGELAATIRCRGWWTSLSWQYYKNDFLATATTTAQIEAILNDEAQFITASDILVTGDISLSQYQDGTKTALAIVENLIAAGLADGSGLLATVSKERVARIWQEPTADRLHLTADGQVTDLWGNPLLQHTCPVGEWCMLRDVVPPTVDVGRLANPTRFFVQRSEFSVATWTLVMEPRGTISPWQALTGRTGVPSSPNAGQTWVGLYEGPHVGMFAMENQDDGTWSVMVRAVDTANVPFMSVGGRNYRTNSKWVRIGYEDALHISLGETGAAGDPETHPDIQVPAKALTSVGVPGGQALTADGSGGVQWGDAPGAQGPQGAAGPQGPSGGPQGSQGATGSSGSQGSRGYQGYRGYQGSQGATGSQGSQGSTGGAGRVLLSEQTPTGTTVTFSDIPATYKSLYVEWVARTDKASVDFEGVSVYLNNDTTDANYYRERILVQDTNVLAAEASDSYIIIVPAATAVANSPCSGWLRIVGYASTVFCKNILSMSTLRETTTSMAISVRSSEWANTAAVTRIDIVTNTGGNFVTGSTFRLYGEY